MEVVAAGILALLLLPFHLLASKLEYSKVRGGHAHPEGEELYAHRVITTLPGQSW